VHSEPAPLPPVCILAGGLGTRLGTRTRTTPKPLIEVAGRPFLFHQLDLLKQYGAWRIVLCVGHLGRLVEDAVGDGDAFGLEVRYSYDGPSVIGTAAAVRQALPDLGPEFMILYGDTYLRIDYQDVAQTFRASGLPALMTVLRNAGQWGQSNAGFDGRIVRYDKHTPTAEMEWIDYGLSVVSASVFELVPSDETDLARIFTLLSERELVAGYAATQRFYEIGTPAALEETEAFLRSSGEPWPA
jgi:NDP-sugar pyrophosphorylase family protein